MINVLRETGNIVVPCVETQKECGFNAVLACYNLKSLFADFTISLSEVSTITAMNDPSNRTALDSFVRPEMADDESRGFMLNLLYRISSDGLDSAKLRTRCQGKGNTLTVIEDTKGSVFGIYAEGEWKEASPNFNGKRSFYFCLTEKVPRKEDLSKKTFYTDIFRGSHGYLLLFAEDFYITVTGVASCNLGSQTGIVSGYRQQMNIKEFEIYQIEDVASAVNVDPAPTSTSSSGIPDPNPYGIALESDGKLSALANKVTNASSIIAETMAVYNKMFVARLRSLSESVFKAEKELLMEILLVRQLTAPARCRDIKAGLQGRWEAIVAKNSAMTSTNCGNILSVMIKELLYQLNIMGVAVKKSNKKAKPEPKIVDEREEVVSYNVGGTIIAVLKSTLLRHAPDSAFASRASDRWPNSAEVMENGHICLVST
jgi:TLD